MVRALPLFRKCKCHRHFSITFEIQACCSTKSHFCLFFNSFATYGMTELGNTVCNRRVSDESECVGTLGENPPSPDQPPVPILLHSSQDESEMRDQRMKCTERKTRSSTWPAVSSRNAIKYSIYGLKTPYILTSL